MPLHRLVRSLLECLFLRVGQEDLLGLARPCLPFHQEDLEAPAVPEVLIGLSRPSDLEVREGLALPWPLAARAALVRLSDLLLRLALVVPAHPSRLAVPEDLARL